jgi:hypothetical protein
MVELSVGALENLEKELRSGNVEIVKKALAKINGKKIPRNSVFRVANLLRRIGHYRTALRLLAPVIHPNTALAQKASQEELVEYAANLIRLGIAGEALKILNSVQNQKVPEVLLYKAFSWVISWDYPKAIILLKEYLSSPGISAYQQIVAKINLASYYVQNFETEEAKKVLNEILEIPNIETQKQNLAYAYQTYAELSVLSGDFKNAKKFLEKAKGYLSHYRYSLYNRQWSSILEVLQTKGSEESLQKLAEIKSEAATKKVWEVVRECDLFAALVRHDEERLLYLYFGTPHELFRERILKLYDKTLLIPKEYIWHEGANKPAAVFDLQENATLKKGQLLHKLLQTLASDFYRPFKMETLCSRLFPDEIYSPGQTPAKVYDLVSRLRHVFKKHGIALEIVASGKNEFKLDVTNACGVKVTLFANVKSKGDYFLEQLRSAFKDGEFSCNMAIQTTGRSRSTCKRNLREALEKGILSVRGHSQFTRYKFR